MSDIVIQVEGLGKKYLIGHQTERERYTALRGVLAQIVEFLTCHGSNDPLQSS